MSQPLTIRFATDVEGAKAGIANLASSIASNMVSVGSALKAANDNVGRVSSGLDAAASAARGALPAIVALGAAMIVYHGVAAAVDAARESIDQFVKIGNQARDAGVSGSFLQRWQGEAKTLNMELTRLTAMLDRARTAATVSIGEQSATPMTAADLATNSPGGRRLQQNVLAGNLGAGDLDAYRGANSQEDRIRAVLDLIDKLTAAQKNLAAYDLGKTFFGEDFEKRMREGVAMTERMRDALNSSANAAGGNRIVSEEELQRARDINQQIVAIDNLMASGLAPIQQDLIRLGQDQYKGWLDIKQGIAGVVKVAGELYSEVRRVLLEIDKITGRDPLGTLATKLGATRIRDMLGIAEPASGEQFGPPMPKGMADVGLSGRGDKSNGLPSLTKPSAGSEGSDEKTSLERYLQQLEKANQLAQTELENVGKSNIERATAVALTKARVAAEQDVKDGKRDTKQLTDVEIANITHLAEVEQRARDMAADLNQTLRQNAETMRYLGSTAADALGQMIFDGTKASDVLKNLATQVGKSLLSAGFTGSGPLAGILGLAPKASDGANASGGLIGALGKAFGIGANADGTDSWRGGLSWVGERGPELVNLPRGAQVVPNHVLRSMGGGSDGSVSIRMGDTHINAPGGDMNQISAMLDARDRAMADRLPSMIRDAQGRRQLR